MNKLNIKKLGWVLSIFFSLAFVVCFAWAFILKGELYDLHLNILRMTYLFFGGIDFASFISGLVQTFIWGWIVAAVFGWLWNQFNKE